MIRLPIFALWLATSVCAQPIPPAFEVNIGEIDSELLQPATLLLEAHPKAIHLTIDSPGGSVRAGLEFVGAMRKAQAWGTVIICEIPDRGMAASMATYIFATCDFRYMGKQSMLMFHTVSTCGVAGNQWDLERLARSMESLNMRLSIYIAGSLKIPLKEYLARVKDHDWWVGWEEALEIGAVDAVLVHGPQGLTVEVK